MNRSTNAARLERAQERRDAGSMEERFPEVASIVLTMDYRHRGLTSILRSFSYDPASFAYFRVSCLWKECDDGGFDLTRVITSMIRNRKQFEKGELDCERNEPGAGHSHILYEVGINYKA
ncbi:MAG TPA: hypothetical protein VN260_04475 [Dissulfurispiraceae bacterium]|nr:hypothetical protein [Dissulfurispiraceae bacterium]